MAGKRNKDIEIITNKILVVLSIALVGGILLMGLSYMYQNINTFKPAYIASKILIYVALAGMVFGIYRAVKEAKQDSDKPKYITGVIIAVTCALAALTFYMMAYTNYFLAVKFMYAVIAAAAILYVIRSLYQGEFFTIAFVGAVDAIFLWRFASKLPGSVLVKIIIVLILAVIALLIAAAAVSSKNGTVKLGGSRYRFFSEEASFGPFIGVMAVIFAITLAALFIPYGWITFAAFGIVGIVFCAAVFYTVKLM